MFNYDYKNMELTPLIFSKLMVEILNNSEFTNKYAVKCVTEHHLKNGGVLLKHSYSNTFKKACQYLRDLGLENIGLGYWRLIYTDKLDDVDNVKCDIKFHKDDNNDTVLNKPDFEFGDGFEFVYVYYYDIYKKTAIKDGKKYWLCKIGKSNTDPYSRIISQFGTSLPEYPHLSIIFKTDNSSALEGFLHNVLKLKNRHNSSSPGSEWFLTNPDEIMNIYNFNFTNILENGE